MKSWIALGTCGVSWKNIESEITNTGHLTSLTVAEVLENLRLDSWNQDNFIESIGSIPSQGLAETGWTARVNSKALRIFFEAVNEKFDHLAAQCVGGYVEPTTMMSNEVDVSLAHSANWSSIPGECTIRFPFHGTSPVLDDFFTGGRFVDSIGKPENISSAKYFEIESAAHYLELVEDNPRQLRFVGAPQNWLNNVFTVPDWGSVVEGETNLFLSVKLYLELAYVPFQTRFGKSVLSGWPPGAFIRLVDGQGA